jgi:hypothetical protein
MKLAISSTGKELNSNLDPLIHLYPGLLLPDYPARVIQVAVDLSHTRPIARVPEAAAVRAPFNKPTTGIYSERDGRYGTCGHYAS